MMEWRCIERWERTKAISLPELEELVTIFKVKEVVKEDKTSVVDHVVEIDSNIVNKNSLAN